MQDQFHVAPVRRIFYVVSVPAVALLALVVSHHATSPRHMSRALPRGATVPKTIPQLRAATARVATPPDSTSFLTRERQVPFSVVCPESATFFMPQPWQAFAPHGVTLRPFAGVDYSAHCTDSRFDGGFLSRTWSLAGNENGFATSSASASGMSWYIHDPLTSDFTITVDARGQSVARQMDVSAMAPCGGSTLRPSSASSAPAYTNTSASTAHPVSEDDEIDDYHGPGSILPPTTVLPDDDRETANTINVMFVFTPAVADSLGGVVVLENQCNLALTIANKDFADSRANLRLSLAGFHVLTDYADSDTLSGDLQKAFYQEPYASLIRQKEDELKADMVSMICLAPGDSSTSGRGNLGGVGVPAAKYAACTVLRKDQILWAASHEFGHNLGLSHERAEEGDIGANPAYSSFGYVFHAGTDPSGQSLDFGTIMAYGGTRIHHFSNPTVLYEGLPTGMPRGNKRAADAVYTLHRNASIVAAYQPDPGRIYLEYSSLDVGVPTGIDIVENVEVFNESSSATTLTVMSDAGSWLSIPASLTIPAGSTATLPCHLDARAGRLATATTATIRFVAADGEKARLILTARPSSAAVLAPDISTSAAPLRLSANRDARAAFQFQLGDTFPVDTYFSVIRSSTPLNVTRLQSMSVPSAGILSFSVRAAAGTNLPTGTVPLLIRVDSGGVVRFVQVTIPVLGIANATTTMSRGQFINLSTRGWVGRDDQSLIAGTVITEGRIKLLVRAGGPGLASYGISGTLPDPALHVFQGQQQIAENDNWRTGADAAEIEQLSPQVGAAIGQSTEAAVVLDLDPGSYTFQVTGADGGTGVGIVELFRVPDAQTHGRMVNLSARGFVSSGDDILIAGFVRDGNDGFVLTRGIGPELAFHSVTGALADPLLGVFGSSGIQIMTNDDWSDSSLNPDDSRAIFRSLGAFDLHALGKDASDLALAHPGTTTVQVSGKDGTDGVALVEVYEVP